MNTQSTSQTISTQKRPSMRHSKKQEGVMLLEAMIAILIFSFGILAIIGLQAAAIKNAGDAKFRTDASMLANKLLGQMWADDRTPANVVANYQSPGGAKYSAWQTEVASSGLPDVKSKVDVALTNIIVGGVAVSTSSFVTVEITWQAPSETTPHTYRSIAHIL